MGWIRCPRCGFTQVASEKCLRCGEPLPKPVPKPSRRTGATVVPAERPRFSILRGAAVALVMLAIAVGLTLWLRRAPAKVAPVRAAVAPPTPSSALNLAGRWYGQASDTLPGSPPRPVVKEASIETDRDGKILSARVLLTDPGRGGAGAGYLTAADGAQRVADAVAALSASPAGAAIHTDFVNLAPWVPTRARLWRALEGINRRNPDARYVLLESIEDDYVVQAGLNQSGFLSYAFFSPAYASSRGVDVLSAVIHPEPGSGLADFHNLVWDLSGSTDFLNLQVRATLTGPDGITDRMVLKR